MAGVIDLTAGQAIAIFGWKKPLRVLNWKIVFDRDDLTFKKLFFEIGLNERQLLKLQSDKGMWVSYKRLELSDILLVPLWKLHVTKDFHAHITNIAMLNLSHEFLQYTGVTFEHLVEAGLTVNLMMLLKLSLNAWIQLGLTVEFMKDMQDSQSLALFGIPKNLTLLCLKNGSDRVAYSG
jgi:hypothetical protein